MLLSTCVEELIINSEKVNEEQNRKFLEDLKIELEELKNNLKEKNELYMYAKAENENIKKRCLLENERFKKLAIEKLVNDLFLLTDTIEYGLCFEKICNNNVLIKKFDFFVGLRLIYGMVVSLFEKNDIKQLNPMGDNFNPQKHEAVLIKIVPDLCEKNIVVEVIQKGYVSGDFVFRHAKVIISG